MTKASTLIFVSDERLRRAVECSSVESDQIRNDVTDIDRFGLSRFEFLILTPGDLVEVRLLLQNFLYVVKFLPQICERFIPDLVRRVSGLNDVADRFAVETGHTLDSHVASGILWRERLGRFLHDPVRVTAVEKPMNRRVRHRQIELLLAGVFLEIHSLRRNDKSAVHKQKFVTTV